MTPNRLTLAAIAAATVAAIVGIVVLTALQFPVPELLPLVVTSGLGALGVAVLPLTRRPSSGPDSGPDDGDDGDELGADALALVDADARARVRATQGRQELPRHLTRVDNGQPLHGRRAAA